MKKVLSVIISLLTLISASSLSVSAEEKVYPDTSDDTVSHCTTTRYLADVNNDKEFNIGDLVTLMQFLRGSEEYFDSLVYEDKLNYLDVNLDGRADIFDLVEMRKALIDSENAFKQVSSVDILTTADKSTTKSSFVSTPEELTAYLADIGTDDDEIQKYLELYNDEFFRKSDVILSTYEQEYGEGIHFIPPVGNFADGTYFDDQELEGLCSYFGTDPDVIKQSGIYYLLTSHRYNSHPMLYPKKKSILLFQATIPKAVKENSNGFTFLFDFDLFSPDYYAHQFDSPDGKHKLYITVDEMHFMDDTCHYHFYEIQNDGSYVYLGEYYDGYAEKDLFAQEYTVTKQGNITAYNFGSQVMIKWLENGINVAIAGDPYYVDGYWITDWDDVSMHYS